MSRSSGRAPQRGAVVAENERGRLERVDGKRKHVGTVEVDGRVLTCNFQGESHADRAGIVERWQRWQAREVEKERRRERDVPRPAAVEGEEDVELKTEGKAAMPAKVALLKFRSGRVERTLKAFADADRALDMAQMLEASLEVSGAEGEYGVEEVDVEW